MVEMNNGCAEMVERTSLYPQSDISKLFEAKKLHFVYFKNRTYFPIKKNLLSRT